MTHKITSAFTLMMCAVCLLLATSSFAGTATYSYDELNRLKEVQLGNGNSISYEYDELGNLLSKTPHGNVATITAAASVNGKVFPAGPTIMFKGNDSKITITPNAGYVVSALVVDGMQLPGATSYTFPNVTTDHYINAYFAPAVNYTVTVAAGANGSISPAGVSSVAGGSSKTFTITPNAGCVVTALVVDGTQLPAATTYTFPNITANHYINAYFAQIFSITAAAAANGSISPAGVSSVTGGTNKTFTITPNAGYVVSALVVDGTQLPGATTYTFPNVTTDHYINAYFGPAPGYTITAAAAANGSITPAGAITVTGGTNKTFTITPNAGYAVSTLIVDGTQLPGAPSYTFTNVTTSHYINAYFAPVSP